ncbi:hypothetical protein BGY98DRAFT_1099697 [Russula aff. rugulosa BPL654]|nr:hypothetical protein BGY98DRAFT_1099697 [Russula aff. rugulosa BPL654]
MAKRAPTPSPNRGHIPLPPAKQVALIVGRHGIGEEIALSFVKRGIKIAITYVSHEDEARKASDRIKSRVSGNPEVERFQFNPGKDEASKLINSVRTRLNGLDIVVFASIYGKLSQKNEIFDAEVQAFYKIYQAAVATISKTSSSSYFRVVHVSTQISDTYSDINAAIEALVRTWGENPPSKHATVNAICTTLIRFMMSMLWRWSNFC